MLQFIEKFYNKHQILLQVIVFLGGFIWDNLTLKRIDNISNHFFLFLYFFISGLAIIIINFTENNKGFKALSKISKYLPLLIQFCFGNLFSAYVVYYFHSTSFTKTAIFFFILVLFLVGNEFLEKKYKNIYIQINFYFLVSFSFFIFLFPVILKKMNNFIFILSGLFSFIPPILILLIFAKFKIINIKPDFIKIFSSIITLFLILNIFYFFNFIPPVPLSLKFSGIYHNITKENNSFILEYEKVLWNRFSKKSDDLFYYSDSDTVFCFTSIFAPTELKKKIFHEWQYFDETKKKWITLNKLGFEIVGGRDNGYRGFTYKKNVFLGKWRINVITEDNKILGRVNVKIIDKKGKKFERKKFIYK